MSRRLDRGLLREAIFNVFMCGCQRDTGVVSSSLHVTAISTACSTIHYKLISVGAHHAFGSDCIQSLLLFL